MVAPLPIPLTKAKLPRSITIYGLPDLSIDFTTTPAAQIISSLSGAVKIGAVQKISVEQNIDLHEWRELDADQGGKIVEWAPGKEEITVFLGVKGKAAAGQKHENLRTGKAYHGHGEEDAARGGRGAARAAGPAQDPKQDDNAQGKVGKV